ncbi:hypothetical protein M2281_004477 [Mesorhizobium soli]|uniref:GNAT family N-acetyltransferase n=1 Tax=Pseudaminobacter soli (ex Li et al. 2025) TaxID=1295366 RepID=UPI002472ECF2|nr:GNAT family N-acetyltransferase [Mesorhizobium soli]MDH6233864.1 hypothetical protein [Mesorhizobium soli]
MRDSNLRQIWAQPPPPATTRFIEQPNPFFESWVLDSARRNLLGAHDRFLIAGDAQQIALPLKLKRYVPGWLPTVARIWGHDHCFDTTPLAKDVCREGLRRLFASLAARGIDILRWPRLPMDTAFAATLLDFVENSGLAHERTKSYQRPLLICDASDPDTFLERQVSKKRLAELRRCRRRLCELGKVEFLTYEGVHDAAQWCRDFIELEASGWKGPSGTGTAIGCSDSERAFFEAAAAEGAAAGRIVVHSLTLDGTPVAMTVNFRSGTWLWAYKVAYREDLAHLAPGVQVELEGTRAFLSDPTLTHVDSCMASEHGVVAQLWPDRRPMAEILIAVHPRANRVVRAGGLLWRQYRGLKSAAKDTMRNQRRMWRPPDRRRAAKSS